MDIASMNFLLATKNTTPIIGQISTVMGFIMDGIYRLLDMVGIQNIGLCIIIFSIIIYLLMTPLQYKQQKFSKLSAVMNPEIQKIQKKYQGKRDQESMQRMQEETQAVYAKYGVSATGSCVQLIIQLPVLWALWQVIYKIPAYVTSVRVLFTEAVDKIAGVAGYSDILQTFKAENNLARVQLILEDGVVTKNSIIDFLYSLSPTQWKSLSSMSEFSQFSGTLDSTAEKLSRMQNFLGLNISEMPLYYIQNMLKGGAILLGIIALMIPLLSWFTQVLNLKLMPQQTQQDGAQDAMNSSMKTMNTVMPLMSAVFCFTFPVGLGIYWISSAVVRSIQMVIINRYLDKIDMDDLIRENTKKMEEKRAKQGLPPQKITTQAHQSAKNINSAKSVSSKGNSADKSRKVDSAYEKARTAKPGSITAKANMVRDYNERSKK